MYEFTPLFWYKFVFLAELLIAQATIMFRLRRRRRFWLRFVLSIFGAFALCFAVPALDGVWDIFMYLMLFGVGIGLMCVCFKEPFIKIMFCGVVAYTLQHIAFEIFDLCAVAMGFFNASNTIGSGSIGFLMIYGVSSNIISGNPFTILVYLFVYGLTYFLGYLFIDSRIKNSDFGVHNKRMFIIAAIILFFDIVASSVMSHYSNKDFNKTYVLFLDSFNIFCCIFALYIQFVMDDRAQLVNDLEVIKRLWQEKEEQYNESKANIELINQKCHDLKHQIRAIGSTNALDVGVVKEIENIISIYDSPVKTGNEALDIILTEKSLYCSKQGVKLCCITDGDKLKFMTDADLYALFGNLIDNAIEAVENLDDGKRVISLNIKETSGFLTINIHNYYDKELTFENKLPVSTKNDRAYHGYGMKSVQMLCDKYGGEMSIKAENKVFNLNIVFPMEVKSNRTP